MYRAMSAAVDEAEPAGARWPRYSKGRASKPCAGVQWNPSETSCARTWGMGAGMPARGGWGSRKVVRVMPSGRVILVSTNASNGWPVT